MNGWEAYKAHTAGDGAFLDPLRQKVRAVAAEKNLVPRMNDAKWTQLQEAVAGLPFPPAFILRRVTDPDGSPPDGAFGGKPPWWHGDWSNYYEEGMPPLFAIEWITVWPQKSVHRGRLVPDGIVDATDAFRAILERLGIPFVEERGLFTIHGYARD